MLDFDNLEAEEDKGLLEKAIDLATKASQIKSQIEEYESDIKQLKGRMNAILEDELPSLMKDGNISEFKLGNGKRVTLTEIVAASMPKDESAKQAFFDWLTAQDATDIIKTDVSVSFGKTEHNQAVSLAEDLKNRGYSVARKEGVHHQTLNSFLRERVQRGDNLPPENILPVYLGTHAKVG